MTSSTNVYAQPLVKLPCAQGTHHTDVGGLADFSQTCQHASGARLDAQHVSVPLLGRAPSSIKLPFTQGQLQGWMRSMYLYHG